MARGNGPGTRGGRSSGSHHGLDADSLRELVLERLAEKAATYDRNEAKGRFKAEAIDALAGQLGDLDLWTRIPPSRRKPRLSRDDLGAATVRIADVEGLDALSMRRLAQDLGVGTMTLYHYVRTKDEVLSMACDTVMGEIVVPPDEPLPDDWRDAVTVIAHRTLAALLRHPWMLDVMDDPHLGPNSLRHFDQALQAVEGLDASLEDRLDVVSAVDEYVFGYAFHTRERAADDDDGPPAELLDYLDVLISTGAYPQLAALIAEIGVREAWETVQTAIGDPDRFERNLRRLLDGIEADLR